MAASTVFLAISAGSSIYQGISANQSAKAQARMLKQQAELLRIENNASADRYAREAKGFKAEQSLKFLKSGVQLTGSPLDILDETSRVAAENVSAIRASGEAKASLMESQADNVRAKGRSAMIGGFTNAIGASMQYAYGQGLYGTGKGTGFDIQAEGEYA